MDNDNDNQDLNFSSFGKSRSFKDHLNDSRNPNIYCLLHMDGKEFILNYSYTVELHQKTGDHDTFAITVQDNALDTFKGYVLEHSKNILGNDMSITFSHYGKMQQIFNGVISGINNIKNEGGGYGDLVISGHSPSIYLESGKDCRSFENKTLEQIIKEVCEIYPKEAQIKIDLPNVKRVLPYTVQYQESDYEFIQRLAKRHGEFFYYNGDEMIFGTGAQPTLKIREGNYLLDVNFSLRLGAQEFGLIGYDTINGAKIERDGKAEQSEFKENLFQSVAVNRSANIFKKKPKMHFNHVGLNNSEKELQEIVRLEKEKRENLMYVTGRTYHCAVRNGCRLELVDIHGKAMETYRVIEVKHVHEPGEYYNEFTAIPDTFNCAPYIDTEAVPKIGSQPARVMDNNDPMGMGRVRVQFPWQEDKKQMTPWIRLIQSYSGSGKGSHFIPEIGEEVLVGFEFENAEKPYVMGMQYNGSEMSGYHTAGNDLKAFKTRSGIEDLNNDAEGSWKKSTPDGNFLHFDGQGNATLNIPRNLNIVVGETVNINAGMNMNTNVAMNSTETVGMNKTLGVGMAKMLSVGTNFITNVIGKLSHYVKGDMETFGEKEHKLTSIQGIEVSSQDKISQNSEKEVKNNSGEKSTNS